MIKYKVYGDVFFYALHVSRQNLSTLCKGIQMEKMNKKNWLFQYAEYGQIIRLIIICICIFINNSFFLKHFELYWIKPS